MSKYVDNNVDFDNLTEYETEEIKGYSPSNIYFTGDSKEAKITPIKIGYCEYNFHDFSGFYKIALGDHLNYRFKILRRLGRGSYGEVVEGYDHKTNRSVAIKILRRDLFGENILEEEILKYEYLQEYYCGPIKSVVEFVEYFTFRGHSCLVFELLYIDLKEALVRNNRKGLKMSILKDIMRSILEGLVNIHNANLIHSDLKPSNITFVKKGFPEVKIIDLGNCKFGKQKFKGEVMTRYYRAPEIMLHEPYGVEIDIWSMACTAVELFTGQILFKGEDQHDQLRLVIEALGLPPQSIVDLSPIRRRYFLRQNYPCYCTKTSPNGTIFFCDSLSVKGHRRGIPGSRKLNYILRDAEPEFFDFVQKCLTWDPKERMTAKEALKHPWIASKTETRNCKDTEKPRPSTSKSLTVHYSSFTQTPSTFIRSSKSKTQRSTM